MCPRLGWADIKFIWPLGYTWSSKSFRLSTTQKFKTIRWKLDHHISERNGPKASLPCKSSRLQAIIQRTHDHISSSTDHNHISRYHQSDIATGKLHHSEEASTSNTSEMILAAQKLGDKHSQDLEKALWHGRDFGSEAWHGQHGVQTCLLCCMHFAEVHVAGCDCGRHVRRLLCECDFRYFGKWLWWVWKMVMLCVVGVGLSRYGSRCSTRSSRGDEDVICSRLRRTCTCQCPLRRGESDNRETIEYASWMEAWQHKAMRKVDHTQQGQQSQTCNSDELYRKPCGDVHTCGVYKHLLLVVRTQYLLPLYRDMPAPIASATSHEIQNARKIFPPRKFNLATCLCPPKQGSKSTCKE